MTTYFAERMPIELWIKIFREATYLPEALDTELHDSLPPEGSPPSLHSDTVAAMIHDSFPIRLAISLVCKTWNSASMEFLYEIIVVRDARHLPLLVKLLSDPHLGAARWVQRLDFRYNVPSGFVVCNDKTFSAKQLLRRAVRLLRLCRNIRIFSCRNTGGYESLTALVTHCRSLLRAFLGVAGTLESIEWPPFAAVEDHSMITLYRRYSVMRSMLLPETYPPYYLRSAPHPPEGHPDGFAEVTDESDNDEIREELPAHGDGQLSLPHLHTTGIHHGSPLLGDLFVGGLPSLRHISVGNGVHPDVLESFILRNLQIDTLTFEPYGLPHPSEFVCSTVRTLIFPLKHYTAGVSSPSTERIGLMGTEKLVPEQYDYVFRELLGDGGQSGVERFPKLRLIRLMDAILARTLEGRNLQFKLLYRQCKSKGVRLEDERGRIMEPRL